MRAFWDAGQRQDGKAVTVESISNMMGAAALSVQKLFTATQTARSLVPKGTS